MTNIDTETGHAARTGDEAIRALVSRLSRPHSSGGRVIERAAILADGPGFAAVVEWIIANHGEPEAAKTRSAAGRGLYSSRMDDAAAAESRPPLRWVLPAGAVR